MIEKNTLKKIRKSLGRYLSLMIIILVGVAFYAGIKEAIPNIKTIQNTYYQDTSLMDIKIVSTLGLTEADVASIAELKSIKDVVGSYSKFVLSNEEVVKIHSIEEKINGFALKEGRLPTSLEECVADASVYQIGDIIEISESTKQSKTLANTKFVVVGIITSPLYTGKDYGFADIGNGKLTSYLFIPKENFNDAAYTEIYVTINKRKEDIPYSKTYQKKLDNAIDDIESIQSFREKERMKELSTQINFNGKVVQSISNVNAKWYLLDREEVVTAYRVLKSQYEEVETIADVIPIFFIVIVVLMTSNTMARMVVEERSEMGTFSSLGISNTRIILNYLLYVLTSTILGVVIGFFVGTLFLPNLVYLCFPVTMPAMKYHFDLGMFLMSLFVSCLTMSLVTIYSCLKELKHKPAQLLRPAAPKNGKPIFLEKISFLWKRLSFSWKITLRNIFRYKKRVLMTLVGTAGCTFLIMIGFAIKDSVNGIGDKQYLELFKYDNMIILSETIEQKEEVTSLLEGKVKDELLLNHSFYKVVGETSQLDAYLLVVEDNKAFFEEYFNLQNNETNEKMLLNNDGVMITPTIAETFEITIGDEITLQNTEQTKYQVKVAGIVENYVSNYVYMSSILYEKIVGEKVRYNTVVSKNIIEKDKIASELLQTNKVISISFSHDLLEQANSAISGLNNIVILLVAISSILAFAVLYNLTSINISERIREIATLKVLGFKDSETNEYIYRETLIVVIIGMITGLLITPTIHGYIIDLLENDNMIFLREIKFNSYLYAAILTFSFAIIMQAITFFKLKKVDMIESLKSVE